VLGPWGVGKIVQFPMGLFSGGGVTEPTWEEQNRISREERLRAEQNTNKKIRQRRNEYLRPSSGAARKMEK